MGRFDPKSGIADGSMVLEEGVRRALNLFMEENGRAYRRRLRGLNYLDIDPNSYQEVAGNNRVPSGPPTASSSEAGGLRPHNLGYVYCLLTRGMTLIWKLAYSTEMEK